MPADWVRAALPAGAVGFAGVAAVAAPTTGGDWARAGALLAAAIVQGEITRRTQTVRRESADTLTSVWSLAAAIAVHLTPAIAFILVLHAYRYLRDRRANPDQHDTVAVDAGVIAWSLIAAHFAATLTTTLTAAGPVLAVIAAAVAHLTVSYALTAGVSFLWHRRVYVGRAVDVGLDAALLTVGGVTGALMGGALIVVVLAVPVVLTLHNAALTRELEQDAAVDKKTGLANTATWQAGADRAFADATQDRSEIGVLMVDLDHFKRLNDTYGHRAGDDVLTAVGACLRSQLRQADLAGRFGGEEFTVLLPDTNLIDTVTAAERIRAAIADLHVTTVDNHGTGVVITDVTASVGAATYPHHGTTAQECLRVADSRVYQAKEQGRNRVVGNNTENLTSYPAKRGNED
jgi:diguanylate cyclase (GGDEF)-like protein